MLVRRSRVAESPRCAAAGHPRSFVTKASGSPSPRIAIVSMVHGPRPGSAARADRAWSQSLPADRSTLPLARAVARPANVARRAPGSASVAGSTAASTAGPGTAGTGRRPGRAPARRARPAGPRACARRRSTPAGRARPGSRTRPRRRCAAPGGRGLGHQRRQRRVGGEQLGDRHRVRVQVQQAAAAADGDGQVPQVGEGQLAADVLGPGPQRHDRMPGRAAAASSAGSCRPAIPPRPERRSPPGGQTGCPDERQAERQPQRQGARRRGPGAAARRPGGAARWGRARTRPAPCR